jgi:hypothetical protein
MHNDDADLLDCVVERLVAIKFRLGGHVYRDAAQRALTAIARAALAEGERIAARHSNRGVNVVPFPNGSRNPNP